MSFNGVGNVNINPADTMRFNKNKHGRNMGRTIWSSLNNPVKNPHDVFNPHANFVPSAPYSSDEEELEDHYYHHK